MKIDAGNAMLAKPPSLAQLSEGIVSRMVWKLEFIVLSSRKFNIKGPTKEKTNIYIYIYI